MIDYDPFSDAVMRDPWPFYARLRAEQPVFYSEPYDTWFLSRFEDIWNSTKNDVFTAERGVTPEMVLLKAAPPPEPVFSMLDMPRQRDYRRLLAAPYTKRRISEMAPRIRAIVKETLDPLLERASFDVYADLADPVGTHVIGELIGLPPDEAMPLRGLVDTLFRRQPGQAGTSPEGEEARARLITRIMEIIAARAKRGETGNEDHIGAMLRAEVEGRAPTHSMIAAAAFTMLVTGAEVLPLAVANTAYYLWQHPDQRRQVLEDPSLVGHAFAESLRYDQPTNLLGRFVARDLELRGQRLRTGQGVMFLWSSGNRDELEFERADEFDIARRPRRSLSYGHGIHKCIGEHLGNLEGRLILEALLAAAPLYEVDTNGATRAYSEFLHGYRSVPVVPAG